MPVKNDTKCLTIQYYYSTESVLWMPIRLIQALSTQSQLRRLHVGQLSTVDHHNLYRG